MIFHRCPLEMTSLIALTHPKLLGPDTDIRNQNLLRPELIFDA